MTSVTPAAARSGPLALFRNRNFTLLWLAQFVSELGTAIVSIASSIIVFRETQSALGVGLMLMATALPGLLFGLIAGVFVDRLDRKRTLVAAELLSALLMLLVPFLVPFGLWWLPLLTALKSTVYQFFAPALNSVLPDVASDDELAAANSVLTASQTGAMALGYALAGAITSFLSWQVAFYVDAATFLLSAAMISLVVMPRVAVTTKTSVATVFANLREGAAFIRHAPAIRSMLMVTAPMGLAFGFVNSGNLPFIQRALSGTEFDYSLMEGLGMIGFVAGGLLMSVLADRLREGQWIAISFTGMGLLTIAFSQAPSVPVVIAIQIAILFLNVPSYLGRMLLIQRNTTREVRGRVSAVYFVVRDFSFMAGMALIAVADVLPIRDAFLYMALFLTATGLLALVLPGLRRPTAEWRHSVALLRGISEAKGVDVGRSATMADIERLKKQFPMLGGFDTGALQEVLADMTYTRAHTGAAVVRQGDSSDAAYFILDGSVAVGRAEGGKEDVIAQLNAGDYFGEVAALTGAPRTANVVARADSELLRVPASTLRAMARQPELHRALFATMTERMGALQHMDLPRSARRDQDALRDLRAVVVRQ